MSEPPAPEPAHDVLAAEEFALPTRDPALHHEPITVPDDPTGIEEPHDILAAEEFAMPAPPSPGMGSALARQAQRSWRQATTGLVMAGLLLLTYRLIRRLVTHT